MSDLMEATRAAAAETAPAPATGDPVVIAKGLHKSYDRRRVVLKGVDLTIREGERVALIGSNGSGKSTFLKCLIGLHPISEGEVTTLGEHFTRLPDSAQRSRMRRSTGFVFQKHCLVKRRSVLSNVVHGMLGTEGSWRGFSQSTAPESWRKAALDALAEVNLAGFADSRADALSGGQQQRVAIARALVRRPRLLIADEPAASRDPVSGRDVMALFARLCRQHGITLIFTSHDMAQAREFSDRTVALRAGRIFIDRPSRDITPRDLEEVFDV
ncbi:phosphonate ABC transporter ATP-binding protein [Paracoccus sp. SCSIO 75233]|uniref:phosphonate ABC transporter ATP-binding protein n=1 Tax=Paracoccus sp. SCSIO 75233 TaxID=3017782 RepID=UPI0022F05ADD|nr:ATP-binding cassette domain-containing protein [Paracoccus sp. SCSIO 75233]WBU54641.1 ATP-binding cassette domain-containing protein [Paracoccus sp. SCSIO 75233]